jgi:hypothetical protein
MDDKRPTQIRFLARIRDYVTILNTHRVIETGADAVP